MNVAQHRTASKLISLGLSVSDWRPTWRNGLPSYIDPEVVVCLPNGVAIGTIHTDGNVDWENERR